MLNPVSAEAAASPVVTGTPEDDTGVIKRSCVFKAKYRKRETVYISHLNVVPHPLNRGGDPVKVLRCSALTNDIAKYGWDKTEAEQNAVLIEVPPHQEAADLVKAGTSVVAENKTIAPATGAEAPASAESVSAVIEPSGDPQPQGSAAASSSAASHLCGYCGDWFDNLMDFRCCPECAEDVAPGLVSDSEPEAHAVDKVMYSTESKGKVLFIELVFLSYTRTSTTRIRKCDACGSSCVTKTGINIETTTPRRWSKTPRWCPCKTAVYCDRECQRTCWKEHKKTYTFRAH